MSEHRISHHGFTIQCSCGWLYSNSRVIFEDFWANRAIKRHLEPRGQK